MEKLKKFLLSITIGLMVLILPFTLVGCNKDSDITIRIDGEYIQWAEEESNDWKNLLTVDEIKDLLGESYKGDRGEKGEQGNPGINGKEVEFRNNGEFIQWRYVESSQGEDENWENLISVNSLKGDKGGPTWLSGSSNPTSTLGEDGDLYLNTTTYNIYKRINGSWSFIGNIEGDDGNNGNRWHPGTGSPSYSLGNIGDFYLDTSTYDVYEKQQNSSWIKILNIKGEDLTFETYQVTFDYGSSSMGEYFDNYVTSMDIRSTQWITNMPEPIDNFDVFEGWYIEGTNKLIENYDFIGGDVTLVAKYKTDNYAFSTGCSTFAFNSELDGYESVIDRTQKLIVVPTTYNDGENGEKPVVRLVKDSYSDTSSFNLELVVIPNSVKVIDDEVFYFTRLHQIQLPSSLKSIGKSSFYMTYLKSVYIPQDVSYIGINAFGGCHLLNSIHVDKSNQVYDSRNKCNAIIETATQTLVQGCAGTINPNKNIVHVEDIVTTIGEQAFYACSTLKNISLYMFSSVESYAFSSCSGLESATITEQSLIDEMISDDSLGGLLNYIDTLYLYEDLNIENADYLKENFTLIEDLGAHYNTWVRKR